MCNLLNISTILEQISILEFNLIICPLINGVLLLYASALATDLNFKFVSVGIGPVALCCSLQHKIYTDEMAFLSPDHFLSLPRPDLTFGQPLGVPDTSTLAAHDFDVDTRTGFLPPQPPLSRLPFLWEPWEAALDDAVSCKLQLGDKYGLTAAEMISSTSWRTRVSHVSAFISPSGYV